MTQPRVLAVGDVFVNHRIEGVAGRGGMGVVYRAIDLDLDRTVALKVISPALAERADFRSRFVAESKAAASIEHPHVIPVYYAGQREGVLFIAMRYIDGVDLDGLVRACGRLDPVRAVRIVAQVADALDAAHERGLVHRDVKPANILLGTDDHAYLTDFGLTKPAASSAACGGWAGTPGYLAPEQIRGGHVDARADVYALGCVLVHAITGAAPYVRADDGATLRAHLTAPVPVDGVPQRLAGVIERAMAKDPDARFASASELGLAALTAVGIAPPRTVKRRTATPPVVKPPPRGDETQASPPIRIATRGQRWRAVAVSATLLALATLVFAPVGHVGDPVRAGTAAGSAPRHTFGTPMHLGVPPDAIATAGGRVWVLSSRTGEMHVLDAITGRERGRVDLGASAPGAALAAGFGAVWAVKASTRSLIRIDTGTRRRHVDTATRLDVTGSPDRVVVGEDAVWVAARDRDGGSESIVKVDPETFAQEQIALPPGTRQIAVGRGAVWVTNWRERAVLRIDAQAPHARTTISVAVAPDAIAVTRGGVWITTGSDRAVIRIDPATGGRTRAVLEDRPRRIAVVGGSAWVIGGPRVYRLDPVTLRVLDAMWIAEGPSALAPTGGRSVWLALPLTDSAQRVTVRP
jgi:hypothetical protein